MKQKLLTFLLVSMLAVGTAFAQNRTITGKVVGADDGLPLPGVSVRVKGGTAGTTTTGEGTFSLAVPDGTRTLTFTYIGYTTTDLTIPASGRMEVRLVSDAKQLSEVVVVGYGSGKSRSNVVGSVAQVSSTVIEEKPVANVFDVLQGKVAGLQVFTSSGEPSQTSSLRLHGVGSLGASSTPLYLMDGIPVEGGTILSINPNDIENVAILKDASATSIYGSRAANGVVYITTKKGRIGKPAEISVRSMYGTSQLANTDFFTGFMNTKQLTDFWVATGYRSQQQVDALLAQYPFDTQWYKAYYKDSAPTHQTDLSVSGGGDKTTYYVSGSYFYQDGLAYRSAFDRITLRSNINSTVNDWMQFGLNLSLGTDERETNPYGSNSTNRGLALLAAPFYSPVDKNGNEYPDMIPGWNRYNAKYLADKNPSTENNVQFNPSAYIQLTPLKNLTFKAQAGMDAYDYRTSSRRMPSYLGSINNGSATEEFTRGILKTFTNTLEYKFNLINSDHNFTALAGQEYIDNTTTGFWGSSAGQTDDRLVLIQNGPNDRNASSSRSEYAYNSVFGRLEYNFNNRYFIDGSLRQDASSRFGKDNRTAMFWSVGAMWKAKQESFLAGVDWLDNLTVRASTGTSGNSQIGNYQSLPLVGTSQYDGATGWNIDAAGNPQLAWETQQKTTVGIAASFFNTVRLDAEFYNRNTKNMLISVPYPYTSGFSSITSNVGTLTNYGLDLNLDFDVWTSNAKKAYVTPYVTLNMNKNKITELFQGKSYWIIPNTGVSWVVGQPVSFFYPVFAGVDPQTGSPQWYKPNADPDQIVYTRKDKGDVTSAFNTANLQQNTGIERYPWLNGGFGLNAGYQGLYLQADFSFSEGKYLINNDRYFFENPNQFPGFNQSTRVLDYWKNPGDQSLFPRYGVQFTQFDSRLIEDASFLRLKTMTLGYNLPGSILKSTKAIKGAKVYVVGRNLMTFTKYMGPDPEVDSNLALGTNPNTKQLSFGLELRF